MTAEQIALLGLLISTLVTSAGWIFTYLTQQSILSKQSETNVELAKLQDHLTSARDLRTRLVEDKLSALGEMEDWFEKGRSIYLQGISLESEQDSAHSLGEMEKLQQLFGELGSIRSSAPRFYYLAKLYDPEASNAPPWAWGTEPVPSDLPQIIIAFEEEVYDQVFHAALGPSARSHPFIDEQYHALHEEAVRALDRVKREVASAPQSD